MAERSPFSDVRARLAALRDRGPAAPGEVAPPGTATPDQRDAMQESMEILSDPQMLTRVRASRVAVAHADVIPLEEIAEDFSPPPDGWRVVLTGPVAGQLAEAAEPSSTAVLQVLRELAATPAERGRALGMGMVGVWSARAESHRVLYSIYDDQRLVTVLSLDER